MWIDMTLMTVKQGNYHRNEDVLVVITCTMSLFGFGPLLRHPTDLSLCSLSEIRKCSVMNSHRVNKCPNQTKFSSTSG